ncbi:hypothetical protein ABEP17_09705 [Priestia flexa]|uniref:hypothetical protein n=1 Tax=Priestia flexa TaxID=86664 RepID=UPI00077CA45D|nr:hypothetical protein [Priestia flexa]USY55422.1 hypothetical protein NIZ91_01695 [Bacillus sp. 1780r2a1]MDT2048513.1 hypothetical protein [Priestia flexa]MDT2048561.1 hypothetical protein [Priestia flexa]MEC0668511.1 hypothetical protein [Priestia flexa]MED4590231.1 hypothetical protein [Priestia flexa]
MKKKFQLMFVFRTKQLSLLHCVGMDYENGAMFCVLLNSPNDSVQIDCMTDHYPKSLMSHLSEEKERIDCGFYDIRTWGMSLYH